MKKITKKLFKLLNSIICALAVLPSWLLETMLGLMLILLYLIMSALIKTKFDLEGILLIACILFFVGAFFAALSLDKKSIREGDDGFQSLFFINTIETY